MPPAAIHPRPLRLVSADVAPTPHTLPADHIRPTDPADPRWVFAVRVAQQLDGGRAAILCFEKRKRLHHTAKRLGLRPFDAGLVIAIVQDAARTGRPLGPATTDRLSLVGMGRAPSDPDAGGTGVIVWAGVLGTAFFALGVAWITGQLSSIS